MTRTTQRTLLTAVAIAGVIGLRVAGPSGQAPGFPTTKNGEWPYYTADVKGSRYSPLDQIDASNFNQLEGAWRFKTDNLGTRPEFKLEGTPLMVRGVLYATGGTRRSVVALDGATGGGVRGHGEEEGGREETRARAGVAATAFRTRARVLDRWQGRTHPICHAGISADRTRRQDRRA